MNDDSPAWNEEARIRCEFRFKCPQVWDRLRKTAVEGVRHCPECNRDVYLALTKEDVREHSDEGRCIAVPVLQKNPAGDTNEPSYWWDKSRVLTTTTESWCEDHLPDPHEPGKHGRKELWTMKPRTMSRRVLCKTLLSMGMVAAIDPLRTFRTGFRSESSKVADQADEFPGEQKTMVRCYLRARSIRTAALRSNPSVGRIAGTEMRSGAA